MTIRSVDATIVDLPTTRPHVFARTTMHHQSCVIVRVRTEDGVEGVGEGTPPGGPWWGGEGAETIKACIDAYLAPLVVGEDGARVEALRDRLDRLVPRNSFAKAAIEMALLDALGKTVDVPVHQLLGGLCNDSLPVTWALGAVGLDEMLAETDARLEAGHRRFKLKMGALEPPADVARVVRYLERLEGRAPVFGDPNGVWDEATTARCGARLADAGLELLEQPTPAASVDAMRRLSQRLPIPIMADESVRDPVDALRVLGHGGAALVAVKPGKSGGLLQARRVAAIAGAAGARCFGGTALEGSIGTAGALHMCASLPSVPEGCELFGPLLLTDDVVAEPLRYEQGRLHVPHGPGLGIELDVEKLAAYSRDGRGGRA